MKKILFLIPTLDKGGAENVLVNLVNNMDYEKFDITVQTLFDQNSQKSVLNSNIKYKSFLKKQFRGNSVLFSFIPSKLLYRIIVNEEYDIVVSYLEGPTTHILCGCPYMNSKKVAWVHVEFETDKQFSVGFRSKKKALEAYNSVDRIIYVANSVKSNFEKSSEYKILNGSVMYNTVESDKIINLSNENVEDNTFNGDAINIISVGRIIPAKGYDVLVKIHKRLRNDGINVHTYILGTGFQQKEIEDYLKSNNFQNTFTFLGFKDNPHKYVENADLYVCSSRREGFSTAVTESLIVGTPVVSTNCSGAYELLGENNEYGIVTDNNEDALYEGIKTMLTTPGMLEDYAARAKERGKYFSTENTVKAVEEMLESL